MGVGGELSHQPDRQRRGDERTAAEAHDRHAGRHAWPIRKPSDQGGHGRNVADAKPASAEHAVAEIDQPDVVHGHAERGDQEASRPAQACGDHRAARPAFLHPAAKHGRGDAQEEDRDAEDPAEIGELPISGGGLRDADQLRHRQVEHAERIGLADAQVHAQRGWRHHPAAKADAGDGALAAEHAENVPRQGRSAHGRAPGRDLVIGGAKRVLVTLTRSRYVRFA